MTQARLQSWGFFPLLPNAEEYHHAHDKREDAYQVHAPHDFRVHQGLARELAFPLLLVVVVERCAQEYALACACSLLGELEPEDLEEHGAGFGNDDHAHDGEEQPRLHQDEHDADGGAKAYGARIAHVDFGRGAVEPQVGEQRTRDGHGYGEEFVAAGQVRHVQVRTEDEVATHIGDKAHENHARKDWHRDKAVETVGKVRSVCASRDDERHEGDKNPVGEV